MSNDDSDDDDDDDDSDDDDDDDDDDYQDDDNHAKDMPNLIFHIYNTSYAQQNVEIGNHR